MGEIIPVWDSFDGVLRGRGELTLKVSHEKTAPISLLSRCVIPVGIIPGGIKPKSVNLISRCTVPKNKVYI